MTENENRVLLLEGLATAGKPIHDYEMVLDHKEALEFVVNKTKIKKITSSKFIQEISAKVMRRTGSIINSAAGIYDVSKGEWRKSAFSVGTRYFVGYEKIEREVDKLCTNINKRINTVRTITDIYDLVFVTQFYLVSIRPFADGNGRVSRLLMNYILAYHKQPLATIFAENKVMYYEALEKSREAAAIHLSPIRTFLYLQQAKYLTLEINKFNKGKDFDLGLWF